MERKIISPIHCKLFP